MGREGPRRELRFWKGVLPVKYKTTVADSDFSFFFAVVRGGRGGAGSLFPRRAGGRGGGEEGKKRRLFPFFSLFLESFSPEFPPLSSNSLPFSVDDAPPRGLSHPCGRDSLDVGSLVVVVDSCVGEAAAPDGEERSGGKCGDGDNNNPVRFRFAVVRELARRGRGRGSQGCDPRAHRRHARTREFVCFCRPNL